MSVRELTSFIYHRDHRRCRYCDRMLRRSEATVDHYVPRHLGGSNEGDNLRLSCHPCNSEKGCMPPEEHGRPSRHLDLFEEARAWASQTGNALPQGIGELLGWLTGAVSSHMEAAAPTAPIPAVDAVAGEPVGWLRPDTGEVCCAERKRMWIASGGGYRNIALRYTQPLYATPPRAGSEMTASASGEQQHDELSRDADGGIAIDWKTKDGDMLSMSLSKEGRLAWAIHRAGPAGCGTAQLNEACFRLLDNLIDDCEAASASVHDFASQPSVEESLAALVADQQARKGGQGVMGAEVVALPEPVVDALKWLDRLSQPGLYPDKLGPLNEWLKSHPLATPAKHRRLDTGPGRWVYTNVETYQRMRDSWLERHPSAGAGAEPQQEGRSA